MFLMLHDAYGVQKDSKHTYDLAKDCMNFLGGRYGPTRPLLVDEYQNFTPTVLRELLHLQERCGFALYQESLGLTDMGPLAHAD